MAKLTGGSAHGGNYGQSYSRSRTNDELVGRATARHSHETGLDLVAHLLTGLSTYEDALSDVDDVTRSVYEEIINKPEFRGW
jgi:hypothetical protein